MRSGAERASLHPLVGAHPIAQSQLQLGRFRGSKVAVRADTEGLDAQSLLLRHRTVNECRARGAGTNGVSQPPLAAFTAAVSAGTTSKRSPTTPRFATSKI